jgi:hypothetical protein
MAPGDSTFSARTMRNNKLLSGPDAGTGSHAESPRLSLAMMDPKFTGKVIHSDAIEDVGPPNQGLGSGVSEWCASLASPIWKAPRLIQSSATVTYAKQLYLKLWGLNMANLAL